MRLFASLSFLLAAVVLTAGLGGCMDASSRTADQQAEDKRTIRQLQEWNQRLLVSGRQKDDRIRSMTRLVYKMIDDLAGVSNRQGLVRGVRFDQPVYLEAEFPQTERSIRAAERQFVAQLSVLESNLQEGQQKVDRLRQDEVEPSESVPTSALDAARAKLDAAESRAATLAARVDSLERVLNQSVAQSTRLESEAEQLAASNEALRRAYVIIGSQAELEAQGVIEKRFLRSATLDRFPTDTFSPTSIDARVIPFEGASATVLSLQRKDPSLYTVEPGRLVIHDPNAFWAYSRYLILETEG